MDYATVTDITRLKRSLSLDEQSRAAALIPEISNAIRYEAQKVGKNFDEMVFASELGAQWDLFNGDGSTTEFTLSDTPTGVITVMIGNAVCTAYTLNGDEITFDEAPADEVEILVSYQYRILLHRAKAVTVDVVMRELNTPGNQLPATSFSESAGSVSQSFTLPNSSGAVKLWPSDLKALGLKRQQLDAISLMKTRPQPPPCPKRW
jgi:hypothetical protein